jgi:hypothetical protein
MMNITIVHTRVFAALLALAVQATACLAQDAIEVDAVAGEPFGVGRLVAFVDPRDDGGGVMLTDHTGRVFYPTYSSRPVRRILRELVGAPRRVEALFLFTGNAPLELNLASSKPTTVRVRPRRDAQTHADLLNDWWNEYASLDKRRGRGDDYPSVIDDYLTATLARRLQLPLPPDFVASAPDRDLKHAIRVLGGAESVHSQMVRQIALGGYKTSLKADITLPEQISLLAPAGSKPADVPIEPIALHVPAEMFYVRFGSFTNYLWFSHRLDDWGGQVRNLVSERSIDYGINDRLQEQLCLKESALAEILGPTVISDVALVGADMFMREGAAMGVLFEARNNLLLSNDFNEQRAEALKENASAVEEQLTIDDVKASFIHTPDNRLRSYYVTINGYHFVTTSRALAERFIRVAKGEEPLGKTAEFVSARSLFPVKRQDVVFVYLSSAFLQNLLSPAYQVELHRRLRSLAEMDVLGVARLEAKASGLTDFDTAELIEKGILPVGFGDRPDGSKLVESAEGLSDSLRGPRGSFIPIPDMPTGLVTKSEAEMCEQVAENYSASWEQMTPLMAAIARADGPAKGLERVTLDVRATPLAGKQYKLLASQLGSPSKQRQAPIEGDVVAFDAVLNDNGADYHLFGGLRDIHPRMASGSMLDKALGMLGGREIVGYLGAWPRPGWLWLLGATANSPVDSGGYSQFITGGWRRVVGKYTLLSFQREILAEITPQLRFEPVDRPAQVWLHADDLRSSRLAPAANAYGYRQATELSRGNAQFLNSMHEQLHVPVAECLTAAESLLAAKLICPLGGKYEFQSSVQGSPRWRSTAISNSASRSGEPPADYEFPALYWLRGVDADVRLTEAELAVHADFVMPVKERPALQLPAFKLPFGNPLQPAPTKPKAAEPKSPPREF